jgi:hypothetical protein
MEKPISVEDALSQMSGIPTEEVGQIWQEVKSNYTKLSACGGPHLFTIPANRRSFADDFICELCGGKVSSLEKTWYERGITHGRGEIKGKVEALLAEFGYDPNTALMCIGELVSNAKDENNG